VRIFSGGESTKSRSAKGGNVLVTDASIFSDQEFPTFRPESRLGGWHYLFFWQRCDYLTARTATLPMSSFVPSIFKRRRQSKIFCVDPKVGLPTAVKVKTGLEHEIKKYFAETLKFGKMLPIYNTEQGFLMLGCVDKTNR
jgi:hypothetical protein